EEGARRPGARRSRRLLGSAGRRAHAGRARRHRRLRRAAGDQGAHRHGRLRARPRHGAGRGRPARPDVEVPGRRSGRRPLDPAGAARPQRVGGVVRAVPHRDARAGGLPRRARRPGADPRPERQRPPPRQGPAARGGDRGDLPLGRRPRRRGLRHPDPGVPAERSSGVRLRRRGRDRRRAVVGQGHLRRTARVARRRAPRDPPV
ncbi:MAG: hypothetical protein AVDCRST_MAG36-411, partial [uncultured Nocardioidaceae bacterium]